MLLTATYIVAALVITGKVWPSGKTDLLVEKQRAELVSSISHELRTPLTAVVGFLDLLDDPEVGPTLAKQEKAELISTARSQAAYLSRIVHDLVMLARGSLDLMELHRDSTDVADLVRSAVASVDVRRQEVVVDVEDSLRAFVDADRIQQVVVNLLSNASRYGDNKVVVAASAQGSTLCVDVHDDGPGVPKKYELTIWERFERGPNRLNAKVPGSGIGLAVVSAIASSHGGSADYRQSERLGGACFRVVLPNRIEAA